MLAFHPSKRHGYVRIRCRRRLVEVVPRPASSSRADLGTQRPPPARGKPSRGHPQFARRAARISTAGSAPLLTPPPAQWAGGRHAVGDAMNILSRSPNNAETRERIQAAPHFPSPARIETAKCSQACPSANRSMVELKRRQRLPSKLFPG